ncbi:MAG: sulfite exporter TauE/SafE family protein [Hahellaceae bacterium]|nr:sulfite exporter TauE/SafE family protein [Hahellaceae bacterium]
MIASDLIAAFLIGLLGSSHCLLMCGGLASALSLKLPITEFRNGSHYLQIITYNSGRISSYTLAGLVGGFLISLVADQALFIITLVRTVAAALLIFTGLYIAGWSSQLVKIERFGQKFWNIIKPDTSTPTARRSIFILGVIWGWLPCGLVYSTLVWSALDTSPYLSSLKMLFFGLGTLPAMISTGLLASSVRKLLSQKSIRQTSGILLIGYGFWTLPVTHSLW